MYTIFAVDIINGEKTFQKRFKPRTATSIAEIDKLQDRMQKMLQRRHIEPITVLLHYKCLINDHIPHK